MTKRRYAIGALYWLTCAVVLLALGNRLASVCFFIGIFVWLYAAHPRGGWNEGGRPKR